LTVGNMPGHGFNLVGSAVQNGQRLIVVVLDAAKSTERAEEARRLFNWGFHGFETRTLFEAGAKVGAAKVFGGADSEAPLVSEAPIRLMTPRGSSEKLSGKIVYTGPLIAPVEAGETVARLKIYRGAMLALDVPLKTGAAVEQGPLTQRAKDAALELGLQLFHKGVSKAMHSLDRKPETASAPATAP
jgi:D-alanyl-D-alanine carboxypeptidase (penicillin-binding protein 5/6)